MTLHPKDQAAIDKAVDDLRQIYAGRLLAVALHGEAVGLDYKPRKSPLALAIVLTAVSADELAAMHPHIKSWQRRRVVTPLVLDPRYIETSVDVFPLEFIDLMDRHFLLHGKSDPFAGISIQPAHLRAQIEAQLRGKMLHLWEAFLASAGSPRAMRRVLLETTPDFATALRGLLLLGEVQRPLEMLALLAAVESRFELNLETFHALEKTRQAGKPPANSELATLFTAYLDEVRGLVQLVDKL
ncbi:MAG: hypothetical protein ACE5D3_02215 [Candidatus Binatia bacterium]